MLGKCVEGRSVDEPDEVDSGDSTALLCRAKRSRLHVRWRTDSRVCFRIPSLLAVWRIDFCTNFGKGGKQLGQRQN